MFAAFGALYAAALGCDGSAGSAGRTGLDGAIGSDAPDAPALPPDGGPPDGGEPETGPGPEGTATVELPRLPTDPALTRLLVPGAARLLGNYEVERCSRSGAGTAADIFCAFSLPTVGGRTELWVINVTKVAAGAAIPCDGSSPDCRRLTENLWTGTPIWGPSHPLTHRFEGDTLFFHADALSDRDPYEGGVYAWRPAWSAARRLTSETGVFCVAQASSTAVLCVDAAEIERTGPSVFDRPILRGFELRGGHLLTEPTGPLPTLGRQSTGLEDLRWQGGPSPDGKYLAYEAAGAPTEKRSLVILATDAPPGAPPVATLPDAADWQIAHDGAKIYYLAGYDRSLADEATGTLMVADFPSGAAPVELADDVAYFQLLGARPDAPSSVDRGVLLAYRGTGGALEYALLPDRTLPQQVVALGSRLSGVQVATDGRHTVYFQDLPQANFPVAFVAPNGQPPCRLTQDLLAETYGTYFSADGSRVFWIEYFRFGSESEEGWYAQPESCGGRTRFGDFVFQYSLVGNDFVVFQGGDLADSTSWLQFTPLGPEPDGRAPSPRIIKEHPTDAWAVVEVGGKNWVLFAVEAEQPETGLYLHGPLAR